MKKFSIYLLSLLALALFLSACGGEASFSTANIAEAHLTKDEAGNETTSTFNPADTFYLIVDLNNAPDGTTVKAAWTAVSVPDVDPNTLLDEVTLTGGSGRLTFDLKNDNPWPAGEYEVAIFLNDELDRSLDFKVNNPLGEAAPDEAVPEEAPTAVVDTAVATGAVSALEDVKTAVIQIEAQGTFVDPEVGTLYNTAGRGSGFIIDPSGLAVTNNHVVTGAALLKVWVGGEAEPRNARVLGVSECADLAVIDIDGDGFPYLEWYDEAVDVGLDVYAAGFPLGDPEYTLTRGIIAKAQANGETSWASVDGVVQHDATINPGNSGGALVTTDGQVVAVNYSGALSVGQYFAIAQAQALPVIEQLSQGQDFLSIGINGTAVNNGEGLSGIWVSSVKSGSPADAAGVAGGDIITRLEGLVLATDGTMSDYCDILRTHTPEDTLSIEVLRFATEEVLEGQLNGRSLEQSFSFAQEVVEEAGANTNTTNNSAGYSGYVTISDESGLMQMQVPAEWRDVDGSAWLLDGNQIGLSLTAAPDIDGLNSGWITPGVFFGATDQFDLTVDELLDGFDYSGDCTYEGRSVYDDEVYSGKYDFWYGCGSGQEGAMILTLAVQPSDGSYLALVLIQMLTQADLDAADQILATFFVGN
ncbi:MAG: serine protease [Ardenticatenaceae bacterium]|nr:serine protease [Ardenticatenaceae bacterium]